MTIESVKKPYTSPGLTVYGDVKTITLSGWVLNADAPSGNNNTAYPPGSS